MMGLRSVDLSWISGWLTSRRLGRGAQVLRLVVIEVALPCGDGAARRRPSVSRRVERRRKSATTVRHFMGDVVLSAEARG